jgi:hypothetical protein
MNGARFAPRLLGSESAGRQRKPQPTREANRSDNDHEGWPRRLADGLLSGTVNVDHERTCANDSDDDLLTHVERIDVAVDQSRRDVEHFAVDDLGAFTPVGPELKPRRSSDYVPEDVAVTMVMPARDGARLRTAANGRRRARLKRDFANHARRRGAGAQTR